MQKSNNYIKKSTMKQGILDDYVSIYRKPKKSKTPKSRPGHPRFSIREWELKNRPLSDIEKYQWNIRMDAYADGKHYVPVTNGHYWRNRLEMDQLALNQYYNDANDYGGYMAMDDAAQKFLVIT